MSSLTQESGMTDGLCPRSREGLQGHVLGAAAAGAPTDTQLSVATGGVSPSDVPRGVPVVGRVIFLFSSSLFSPDLIVASSFCGLRFQCTDRSSFPTPSSGTGPSSQSTSSSPAQAHR